MNEISFSFSCDLYFNSMNWSRLISIHSNALHNFPHKTMNKNYRWTFFILFTWLIVGLIYSKCNTFHSYTLTQADGHLINFQDKMKMNRRAKIQVKISIENRKINFICFSLGFYTVSNIDKTGQFYQSFCSIFAVWMQKYFTNKKKNCLICLSFFAKKIVVWLCGHTVKTVCGGKKRKKK